MTDSIRFECFCGQRIEINAAAAGQLVQCPSCQTGLQVPCPRPSVPPPLPPVIPQPSKKKFSVISSFVPAIGAFIGVVIVLIALHSAKISTKSNAPTVTHSIPTGVGIKEWHWKTMRLSDADAICVTAIITNNTPHKLLRGNFEVILWGERSDTILHDVSQRLEKVTLTELGDGGYDFVPSNHIKKVELFIPIQKYASSIVKSASLTLISIDSAEMTSIDVSLTKIRDYIDVMEFQGKDVPYQTYDAQSRFLQEKKKQQSSK